MKLVRVAEENKRYYSKEFIHGFNTGAKTQYEADKKETERRGRWIDDETAYICSVCFHGSPNGAKWNYCPNCGALMRGE